MRTHATVACGCYAVPMDSAPAAANLATEAHAPTREAHAGMLRERTGTLDPTPRGGSAHAATRTTEGGDCMAVSKTFRPEDLAATLGISGKVVRAYLRKTYKRPPSAKGSTWVLSAKQASDTLAYFKKRNPEAYAKAAKARARKSAPAKAPKATPESA